ncbi:MAG: PIN/TRAM domain-containing protein [Cellulosilyticum sp.]|nr:PIN/TRAM domain-containing protein [Cellulosilyticum sp.]
MRGILRFLISGVLSGIFTSGVIQIEKIGIIPEHIAGPLDLIYLNKEIILYLLFFGLIYFTVAIPIASKIARKLDETLNKYPMQEILMYIIGLGIGLYVASLATNAFKMNTENLAGEIFVIFTYIGLGGFGIYLVHLKKSEIKGWLSKTGDILAHSEPKILDTSVIIDGRILDIICTGFVEGKIIIPSFVLDELRHIADSSDSLKRNRGRRGLDILNELKNTKMIPVEIMEIDYSDLEEVDSKLLRLAGEIQGKVITNDFNLNKVAKLQKVKVLNINDLANAIKQVVLPSEEMTVTVIKEGKEHDQGLAYLNDGTMIVVEGGKKYVGCTIKVVVSTVLQTSAGRMIFAKIIG